MGTKEAKTPKRLWRGGGGEDAHSPREARLQMIKHLVLRRQEAGSAVARSKSLSAVSFSG